MEIKISQPIFGILVALMKKEVTKICNEQALVFNIDLQERIIFELTFPKLSIQKNMSLNPKFLKCPPYLTYFRNFPTGINLTWGLFSSTASLIPLFTAS